MSVAIGALLMGNAATAQRPQARRPAARSAEAQPPKTQRQAKRRVPLAAIRGAIEKLQPLHEKKAPGDWMTGHPEEKGSSVRMLHFHMAASAM